MKKIKRYSTMWQQQVHVPKPQAFWYVSDLPGHDGTVKSKSCPRSDWGWTTDPDKAILLSPYWQKRFAAFCKRDMRRPWGWGRAVEITE